MSFGQCETSEGGAVCAGTIKARYQVETAKPLIQHIEFKRLPYKGFALADETTIFQAQIDFPRMGLFPCAQHQPQMARSWFLNTVKPFGDEDGLIARQPR